MLWILGNVLINACGQQRADMPNVESRASEYVCTH